jgi:secreted trypsin-like serine protease
MRGLTFLGLVGSVCIIGCGTSSEEFHPTTHSAVVYVERVTGTGLCIGTAIDDRHLLTAAHCVFDRSPEQVSAVAASGDRSGIAEIRVAPAFDHQSGTDDYAILALERPIDLNPVNLIRYEVATEGLERLHSYSLTGTDGASFLDGTLDEPRQVDWKELMECDDPSRSLCLASDGTGTCSGDSGTPLVGWSSSDGWVIAGLLSHVREASPETGCGSGLAVFSLVPVDTYRVLWAN